MVSNFLWNCFYQHRVIYLNKCLSKKLIHVAASTLFLWGFKTNSLVWAPETWIQKRRPSKWRPIHFRFQLLITILKSWYPKEVYYQIWMKPIKKYDWFLYELFQRKFADNNVFGQFMMNVTNFKITLQSFICRPYVKLTIGTLITRLKPTKA